MERRKKRMIQIDIEMPESCWSCPLQNGEEGYCQLTYEESPWDIRSAKNTYRRLDSCPLIEVKEEESDDGHDIH